MVVRVFRGPYAPSPPPGVLFWVFWRPCPAATHRHCDTPCPGPYPNVDRATPSPFCQILCRFDYALTPRVCVAVPSVMQVKVGPHEVWDLRHSWVSLNVSYFWPRSAIK